MIDAGNDIELLNAGTAFTSPRSYYGRLLRCLPLEIDDFVPVIFTGNDFWEEFSVATLRETGQLAGNVGSEYGTRLKAAIARNRNPMFQGLNQAFRFKYRPEEAERALVEVQHSLLDMRDLCTWKGIRLTVLVLPTKQVVEPELDSELFDALCEILDVTYDEARSERVLAERLMAWMELAGIAYVNLLPHSRTRAARRSCTGRATTTSAAPDTAWWPMCCGKPWRRMPSRALREPRALRRGQSPSVVEEARVFVDAKERVGANQRLRVPHFSATRSL